MPQLRQLTPEELQYLGDQGVDTEALSGQQVTVMSPQEYQQYNTDQQSKSAGYIKGGILPTLRAHAGALAGGGMAGTYAMGFAPAVAAGLGLSATGAGATLGVPLLLGAAGGLIGSMAGQKAQQVVEPALGITPQQQAEYQARGEAARRNYPLTSMGTDIVAGALAGGGKPSLLPPKYAAQGILETIRSPLGTVEPVYKQAIANVLTGNALNTAINAGVQYATTGQVDPKELGAAAVAGAFFAQPSALGRRLNPRWEPISKIPAKNTQTEATAMQYDTSEYVPPTPLNMADAAAYADKAKAMTEGIQAENAKFVAQRQEWERQQAELEQQQQAEIQAQQQRREQYVEGGMNWLHPDVSDATVKQNFLKRYGQPVDKNLPPEQKAILRAKNDELKDVPVKEMRQQLYESDLQQIAPDEYARLKDAQQAQVGAENMRQLLAAREQQFQDMQAARQRELKEQEVYARVQKINEKIKAAAIEAERQKQEARNAELARLTQHSVGLTTNPDWERGALMGQPIVFPEQAARVPQTPQVSGSEGAQPSELTAGNVEATTYPTAQRFTPTGERYQPVDLTQQNQPSKASNNLLEEAAKHNVEVGETEGPIYIRDASGNVVRDSQGNPQLARGVSPDPLDIARRLIVLSKEHATSDTGYHELVHNTLRDLRRTGYGDVADQVSRLLGGEEPTAQRVGERYQQTVDKLAEAGIPTRVAEYLKDAYSAAKMRLGRGVNQGDLERGLVTIMRQRHGASDLLNAGGWETPYAPKEGYRRALAGVVPSGARFNQDEYQPELRGDAWLSPDGEFIPAPEGHVEKARELGADRNSDEHEYDQMLKKNYIRIAKIRATGELQVDNVDVDNIKAYPLNSKQESALRNYGIENNVKVSGPGNTFTPAPNAYSRKVYYDPTNEGDRYQPLPLDRNLPPSREEDTQRYNEIHSRLAQLIKDKSYGDEFQRLWKESEGIKNRYKGYVPGTEPSGARLNVQGEQTSREDVPIGPSKKVQYETDLPPIRTSDYSDPELGWQSKAYEQALADRIEHIFKQREHYRKAEVGTPTLGDEYAGEHNPNNRKIIINKRYAESDWMPGTLMHETVHDALAQNYRSFAQHVYNNVDKLTPSELKQLRTWFLNKGYSRVVKEIDNYTDKTDMEGMPHAFNETLAQITDRADIIPTPIIEIAEKVLGKDLVARVGLARVEPEMLPKYDPERRAFYQPAEQEPAKRIKLTQSAVERIPYDIPTEDGRRLGRALHQTLIDKQHLIGRWWNPIAEAAQGMSQEQLANVDRVLMRERDDRSSYATMLRGQDERNLYRKIRDALVNNAEYRREINEPIYRDGEPTEAGIDPYYYPTTTNPRQADIIRQGLDVAAVDRMKQAFKAKQMAAGYSEDQANANWKDFVDAIQGSARNNDTGNQAFFNAARKAEGIPLPDELRRTDLLRNLEAYFRRQASDNSYYHNIESNHPVAASLGYTRDAWRNPIDSTNINNLAGHDSVKAVINELKGEYADRMTRTSHAVESGATATMLGLLTETHKTFSTISQALAQTQNPVEAAKMFVHAVSNLGEAWTHVKENGYFQMDSKKASDFLNTHLTAAERLQGLTKGLRELYTFGGLTEKFTKSFAQAAGEYLMPQKVMMANEGNTTAQRMLRGIDPTYEVGKQYNPQEMRELASEFANMLHGSKDARTLPAWMLHDNEVSAFFKLSSWNIAQTNHFMRNVWTPATEGNYGPLIMSALGATLGGAVIKELREKLAGKKGAIPYFNEIEKSSRGYAGNIPAVAYNWMAMASFAGFAGILSNVAKYPFDFAYRNAPQGATFPLDEVVTNVAKTASGIADALATDPFFDITKVGPRALIDLVKENVQLGRVGINQAIDAGLIGGKNGIGGDIGQELAYKKRLSDKEGDLRRYKMVEGLPFEKQGGMNETPYLNLEQRGYKLDENVNTAIQRLPSLVQRIIETYHRQPEVMLSKLKALKANDYATMPSLDDTPLAFTRYVGFLNRTEGPEAARDRVMDYLRHKAINEAKSSLVP